MEIDLITITIIANIVIISVITIEIIAFEPSTTTPAPLPAITTPGKIYLNFPP